MENRKAAQSKKIMITGANSYIGMSVENWILEHSDYQVTTIDLLHTTPEQIDFSDVATVFHVAGIAHRKETDENAHEYYEINERLAIRTAKAAKEAGVSQFVILSSMGVYGLSCGKVDQNTPEKPVNHYAKAKLAADQKLREMNCDSFKVCIVRPPMVYGKGCRGNYQTLRKFALKVPFFPNYPNQRSMIHITNLASVILHLIQEEAQGTFLPQDAQYINTCEMVKQIASCQGRKKLTFSAANPFIRLMMPRMNVLQKVFGTMTCDMSLNVPSEWLVYHSLEDTIRVTET